MAIVPECLTESGTIWRSHGDLGSGDAAAHNRRDHWQTDSHGNVGRSFVGANRPLMLWDISREIIVRRQCMHTDLLVGFPPTEYRQRWNLMMVGTVWRSPGNGEDPCVPQEMTSNECVSALSMQH